MPAPAEPTGYLLSTPDKVEGLNRLGSAFEHANAWLVLTVGNQTPLTDDEHLRYVEDIPEAPGADKILASHLRFHFGDAGGQSVLNDPDVKAFLEQTLPQATSREHAASLALILRLETRDGVTDMARVREAAPPARHRPAGYLVCWPTRCRYAQPRDRTRCAGRPSDRRRASGRARLTGPLGHVGNDWARRRRNATARPSRSIAGRGSRNGWSGSTRVPPTGTSCAETGGSDRPSASATRHGHRGYQPSGRTTRSSRSCGPVAWSMTDPVEEVRIQASTKVGRLAARSFDLFDRLLFTPWATRGDGGAARGGRDRARLRGGVRTTGAPDVLSMINGWRVSGQPLLQAAAARAYGSSIGWSEPAAEFDALGRLATVDNIHVAIAIGDSLADMLTREPSLASEIFRTLQTWAADRRRGTVGELCFLVIANGLTTIPGGDAAWSTEADMPHGTGPRATLLDYVHEGRLSESHCSTCGHALSQCLPASTGSERVHPMGGPGRER